LKVPVYVLNILKVYGDFFIDTVKAINFSVFLFVIYLLILEIVCLKNDPFTRLFSAI